ncbi:hypothetical protein H4R99_003148 [Coemansia sp. RSA 1722]|nr:hypothetical protein IWW45_005153 [Coemansia sp. RSA 485]KAJ2600823.1 hypothetical protein GGF39_001587 [Coemansia sp. RSA 1721]KAJ2600978.1 hypothetical protein H4R99_003148 [Coemansia sp. RSA 1722]
MAATRVDMDVIENFALSDEYRIRLVKHLENLRSMAIVKSLNSMSPSVVEVYDAVFPNDALPNPVLPIPIYWDDRNTLRFHTAPLLLRPQITILCDDDKKPIFRYIYDFSKARFPEISVSVKSTNTVMANDYSDDDDDDENGSTPSSRMHVTQSVATSVVEQQQEQGQEQESAKIENIPRYIVLAGCLGNGKSHLMCELALRAIVDLDNVRVIYPLDCFYWSTISTATEKLEYLLNALHIAFAENDFLQKVLINCVKRENYDLGDAVSYLLTLINPVDPSVDKGNPHFRLLVFVDNYNEASTEVKLAIKELLAREWIFIVFAARGNRPVDLPNNQLDINAGYSREEAKTLLNWIVRSPKSSFKFLDNLRVTAEKDGDDRRSDELCSLVSEFTWFNPREINELFDRNRLSGSERNFIDRAYDFVTCSGEEHIDDYLSEFINSDDESITAAHSETLGKIFYSYMNMFFGIRCDNPPQGGLIRSSVGFENNKSFISPFIQHHGPKIYGRHNKNKLLAFSCPRIAQVIFNRSSNLNPRFMKCYFGKQDQAINSGKLGPGKGKYASGYSKNLYNATGFGTENEQGQNNTTERSDKTALLQGVEYVDWETLRQEISLHLPSGFDRKVFYTSASKDQDEKMMVSSMNYIDFVVYDSAMECFEFFVVGFFISSDTWKRIRSIVQLESFDLLSPDRSNSNFFEVDRICNAINQARKFSRHISYNDNCNVNVIASGAVFNHIPRGDWVVNSSMEDLSVKLVNIDNNINNMLRNVRTESLEYEKWFG